MFAADVDGDGQIGAYNLIEDNGAYQLVDQRIWRISGW